jgi:Domain of unknown function (DUF4845)
MNHSKRFMSGRGQRGITMFGLLFWAMLLGAVSVVAIKVFPVITEYQTISRMVDKLAREGGSTVPEIRMSFERFKTVEYGIESITAHDLEITKEEDKVVISFAYDKEIELFDPVYLLLKFKGRSK